MEYWLQQFHVFLLILLRVSALLVIAPIFGHRFFLARAKVGLAFMVSLILHPLIVAQGLQIPEGLFPYALAMMREIGMGVAMGFVVLLLFIGIQFAGQLAGLQMGFGIVNVIDPQSNEQVSIIGQFLNILAVLIVLATNGHHLILRGLAASFEAVPLSGVKMKGEIGQKLIELSADIFVLAVQISAPVMISLFLISVALGILARTVPQMNVFIVGFPVQLAVGMAVLFATLPLFYVLLENSMLALERDLISLVDFFA